MLSFLQYISEVFDPKTTKPRARHPDYEGVDDKGVHVYRAGVGDEDIVESFFTPKTIEHGGKQYSNAVEAEFRVNDSWKKNDTNRYVDPREVFRTVHSHFDHFIRKHNPSTIFYDTPDPVRHRIYQMAANKYGIPAINYTNIDTGTTTGRYKSTMENPS